MSTSQAERQFKPCVNGDISFQWESQKFDPHRIETPNLIKFGTVDYVGEMTPSAKFHGNRPWGASRQMREIHAQISARDGANDAFSRKGVPLGAKNSKLIFDP